MANERIIDLNVETSPNNFSTLVGVKDGEVVQIPITSLKHLVGNNLNTLSFYIENAETTPLSVITEAIIDAGYKDKGTCVPVQLNGDWNCFWLCGVYATATAGVYGFIAIDLSDSTMYGLEVDPTEMMLYNFTDHILTEYATKEWVASIRDSLNTRIDNLQNSSGGGASIIDVDEFPSNPSTTAIYRNWQVMKAEWVYKGQIVTDGGMTCEVVDTLPATGNVCYTGTSMYSYYQKADGEAYGYVTPDLAATMGVPVGWYPAATLFGALGYVYNGMIDKIADAGDSGYCILLTKKPFLYCFHNNGSTIEKSAIITSNNFEFDEATGTLVLEL